MDRLLRWLGSMALRRGRDGERVWLAVAAAVWLVRRARRQGTEVAWSGRVGPGERLVVTVTDPRSSAAAPAGGE